MPAKYKVTEHPVWWNGEEWSRDISEGERLGYVISGIQVKVPGNKKKFFKALCK
jgi:hypothetical protein